MPNEREEVLDAISEALGGRKTQPYGRVFPPRSRQYEPRNEYEPPEALEDPVEDWYATRHGGGMRYDTDYIVGTDPELEREVASRKGWDGTGDMYEFLSQASRNPDEKREWMQWVWVPGQPIPRHQVQVFLRDILRAAPREAPAEPAEYARSQ